MDLPELSPAQAGEDQKRRQTVLELMTATSKLERSKRNELLFGVDMKPGVVARALHLVSTFYVHRETRDESANDTWWHREWDAIIKEWRKAIG